jgi:hypothetical protein
VVRELEHLKIETRLIGESFECVIHTTLLSHTLYPNGHSGTDTSPGFWLWNKPTDMSHGQCLSEDRGCGEGGDVCVTLLSDTICLL